MWRRNIRLQRLAMKIQRLTARGWHCVSSIQFGLTSVLALRGFYVTGYPYPYPYPKHSPGNTLTLRIALAVKLGVELGIGIGVL